MGEVQNFTEEHADGVARLYLRAVRGQDRAPGKSLPAYFSHLHLNNPWVAPDMPALVYLEAGKVVGMLGVLPRTMEFRGREIRIATMTLFMVDPTFRNGPGIQLLGRLLKGPQEFSWTDGASGHVGALWSALGGHSDAPYALNWIRILRPFGTVRMGLDRIGNAGRLLKPVAGLVTTPFDFLVSKAPVEALGEPVSSFTSKLVNAGELLECIQEVGWRAKLKPHYTPETFLWLMSEAAKSQLGTLRMVTVSNPDGTRRGWFVYYAERNGPAFVLQVGVARKEDFKDTLLALFRDAWLQGSVCVKGAGIPGYLTAMTELYCIFRHPDDRVVFHSRDPEIANAVRTGDAAITRLDGIGWLRFPGEKWDQ
jgi:hypothetical protein